MAGDATYSVKKMVLTTLSADQLNGGVSTQYAMTQVGSAIVGQVASDAAKRFATSMYNWYASSYLSYVGIAYTVGDILLTIASSGNTQSRDYFVVAPAAGYYSFDVWIPGDWDQPCCMIKIYAINIDGSSALALSDEIVAVSDRVEHRQVFLPTGLCRVNVSVGSGSVKFHSAGHLNQAMLDNPTPLQWYSPNIPVASMAVGLLAYLPAVGSSAEIGFETSLPPTPSNILDGTVTYANIKPMPALITPDAVDTYGRIDFYAEPTQEELDQLGKWPFLNMKAVQVGDAINTGTGGRWQFIRNPDYTTIYNCKAIYHVYY